jgi:cytohesin
VGRTELHDAARKGDVRHVKKLLEKGADPDVKDELGHTPLHLAALLGHVEIVKMLLEHGANPNTQDGSGETPLHHAAYWGRVDVARLLLERGADPDARNGYGKTPLHYAAWRGSVDVVKLLLERGADPNAQNRDSKTPLHEAAGMGHVEVVRLLLQHGADPNVGVGGATLLSFAINHCNANVIKLLLERGASVKPKYLCDAIERECTVAVNALLKRGADVNISCGDDTPLHKAVVKGLEDVVEQLLERGADPNVRDNNYGGTPLHAAASKCHVGITMRLLEHKADPNARDIFGKTPLHVAAENGCAEVVRLLLEYGADPEIRDNRGDTALQIAKKGAVAVLKNWIERRGAEKKLSDRAYLVVERGRRLVKKCFDGLPPDVAEDVVVGVSNWLRLNVPGVPRLVKYDGMENCIYVEYVEGRALREVLAERKKLPETCAVVYALKIAETLQAALERGVVHRDLKPENVVIAKDGVYVLDWEFSARLGEEPRARVGTPRYSPPETRITEKYDVYSLGVMLFEMLTGTANIHVTAFGLRDELAQLIRAMADETPEHRPTMATVRERLKKIISKLSPAEC